MLEELMKQVFLELYGEMPIIRLQINKNEYTASIRSMHFVLTTTTPFSLKQALLDLGTQLCANAAEKPETFSESGGAKLVRALIHNLMVEVYNLSCEWNICADDGRPELPEPVLSRLELN